MTIYFIVKYETQVVEEDCFSITYYVDENGNITEVSSENKPGQVNFDDDIVGLITLKGYNLCIEYIMLRLWIAEVIYCKLIGIFE